MNTEDYYKLLISDESDPLKIRGDPLFTRGDRRPPTEHVKLYRQTLLLSSNNELQSFLETLVNNERTAEAQCASVRGKKQEQKNARYAFWTQRVITSLVVATAMGEPILTQALSAVGTKTDLLDFPVVDPYAEGSLLRSEDVSHHRVVVTERAFLLANFVRLAHTAYSSCDDRWPLRHDNPWYLDWNQVKRIPRLDSLPKIRGRLQTMFTEPAATRQQRMSALHAEPTQYVNPAAHMGLLQSEAKDPSEHTMGESVNTEQQQVLPLIQISDSGRLPWSPYHVWQAHGAGYSADHLSASHVSPAPSVGSAASDVSDAVSQYWEDYFRSLKREGVEDDDLLL